MADPRKTSEYTGIGALPVTAKIDNSTIVYDSDEAGGSVSVGLAVKISADNTVALVGDGEKIYGKLMQVESDGYARVQTEGYCELAGGTGATLTIGGAFVGALLSSAPGYIKAATTTGVCRGEIVDNDDTTRIKVKL